MLVTALETIDDKERPIIHSDYAEVNAKPRNIANPQMERKVAQQRIDLAFLL